MVQGMAGSEAHDKRQHTGTRRGRRRLFEHVESLGGNTLGIREDNQTLDTGGRASYLKREGKVSEFSK